VPVPPSGALLRPRRLLVPLLAVLAATAPGAAAEPLDGGAVAPPALPGDAPPVVDAGPDPVGASEGDDVPLAGSAADPDGDPLTTAWVLEPGPDVDPGATCAVADPAALVTTAACTDDGTFTARLTASDGELVAQDSAAVTLANARPVLASLAVEGGAGVACSGGDDVTLGIAVRDPGANDAVSGRVAWGDGTAEPFAGRLASVVHRFAARVGVIRVQAADDDGGTDVRGSAAGALRLQFLAAGPAADGGPLAGTGSLRLGRGIPLEVDVRDCDGDPAGGLRPRVGLVRLTPGPKRIVDDVLPHSASATGDRMAQDPEDGAYRYVLSTRRSGFAAGPLTPGIYRVTVSDPSFGALSSTVTLTGDG
jgi:hypothetical protein